MADSKKMRVLEARNEEALKKAIERRDAAQAIVDEAEASLSSLSGNLRDIVQKECDKQRKKLERAQAAVDKLSRTTEERRADQIAMMRDTRDAFEPHGFEFHDTGADVGTVVWRRGPVRITLRPDSPGFAKVQIASGTVTDYGTLAMAAAAFAD